jgi:hypothetical protein
MRLLLVLGVGSGVVRGSAIIIYRTNVNIIVVADSKTVSRAGDTGKIDKIKLFEEENIGYVAAGVVKYDLTGYNLHKLAEDACTYHGDIHEKTDYFIEKVESKFIEFLNNVSSVPSIDFRDLTMQIAFFNVTNDVPTVVMVKILPDTIYAETKDYELRIKKTTRETIDVSQVYYLGRYVEMYESLFEESLLIDPVKEMKRLMNIAIEKHEDVGPPIDVMLIDKRGFHWIENDDVPGIDIE